MRLGYYAGASTAAAAACLLKAFHQRPNFYSATVYLSQSNACLLILTNLCLVMVCSFMYGLQRLLYGPLRPIETEQLSEKAWYAVLDTLLAMPSFREDVGGWLLTMFVLLLAGKVWGWIGEGRVDILEQQPPANPKLFHSRLATSLLLSVAFDLWMLRYCVETVTADPRPGMMVIFTFEFAVLLVFSTFTLARYLLAVYQTVVEAKQMQVAIATRKNEIRAEREEARRKFDAGEEGAQRPPTEEEEPIEVDENEVDVPGWEEKRRYLFALEVFTDFVKLIIYIFFFTVSITFNGLPMHIMRDVYMTFASFSKRVSDYVAYRRATSDMNTRYPDATTEEIRGDACIVCRESMVAWNQSTNPETAAGPAGQVRTPTARRDEGLRAKKLPCGHILHLRCLKAWLERQQVCPTCRRPVVTSQNTGAGPRVAPGGHGRDPGQPPPNGHQIPRPRLFNLGPFRIGLLNAPVERLQDVVDQMQGQNGGAGHGGVAAALPANNQGPNHLGLRVPYANTPAGQSDTTNGNITGRRPNFSTQALIMQAQQRLMQDAYAFGLEMQEMNILRQMEMEFARLQGLHRQRQVANGQSNGQLPLQGPRPSITHQQPFPTPQAPDILHGSANNQLSHGMDGLPQGLVLPEGWTLVPLQRMDAMAANRNGSAGPRDERGSPLFIPTSEIMQSSQSTTRQARSAQQPSPGPKGPQQNQSQSQSQNQAPWTNGDDWSFVQQVRDTAANGQPSDSGEEGSASTNASSNEGHVDKGKGRAVEIEDVPDDASNS
ncbi:hypothetical protein M433DRAFT_59021 [Acidomyces richmondensis BFW]|nr:MAG: hypothetical protein FE78DRAFT_153299 [Acidomyces sp. 'richmondensis']KYG49490.1 hypothetical protein M433DRAFT_59021 [Acidomyces richmondensis BFW]